VEKTNEADEIRKMGLNVPLLNESASDIAISQRIAFDFQSAGSIKIKEETALRSHIFDKSSSSSSTSSSIKPDMKKDAHRIKATNLGFDADPFDLKNSLGIKRKDSVEQLVRPRSEKRILVEYDSE
jgi:hypothetical protein